MRTLTYLTWPHRIVFGEHCRLNNTPLYVRSSLHLPLVKKVPVVRQATNWREFLPAWITQRETTALIVGKFGSVMLYEVPSSLTPKTEPHSPINRVARRPNSEIRSRASVVKEVVFSVIGTLASPGIHLAALTRYVDRDYWRFAHSVNYNR